VNRSTPARRMALIGALALALVVPLGIESASATPAPPGLGDAVDRPNHPAGRISPADDLAGALGETGRGRFADDFFGLSVDDSGGITLYSLDTAAAPGLIQAARALAGRGSDAVPVHVRQAGFARDQLDDTRNKLFGLGELWKLQGVEIYGIAINNDGSGLTANTNDPDRARVMLADGLVDAPGGANIVFELGSPPEPLTRYNDYPPYAGGVFITDWSSGADCTSGFGMRLPNGTTAMVTAAHCWLPGTVVRDGGGQVMGTAGAQFRYRDAQYIPTNTWSGVFTLGESYTQYKNWNFSYNGQYVCQSGYVSNQICSLRVVNDDYAYVADPWWGAPYTARGVRTYRCSGCAAGRSGDSGGPVWVSVSGGVQSRGIVSFGEGRIGTSNAFQYMTFGETGWILQYYGGSLLVG
jgi:hypothetical protein